MEPSECDKQTEGRTDGWTEKKWVGRVEELPEIWTNRGNKEMTDEGRAD